MVRNSPMPRLARSFASLGVLLLAAAVWTCHGDSGTNPNGPATSLTFTTGPANVVAGVAIATVTVTALDANGHPATDFAGAITLTIGAGTGTPGATLSGTTTATASLGVASFSGLSIDKSGSGYTLQAAASGLTGAASASFSVVAGPATQLTFSTQPTSGTAGTAIAPAVKVTAEDALGAAVPGFTGEVIVAITTGTGAAGATLSGTTTAAAAAGIATFSDLKIDKVGTAATGTGYTLSATAPSLTAVTSDAFDIQSGTAARLQFTAQPSTSAAGAGFSPLVEVSAFDASGNVVTAFTGNVTLAIGTNVNGATLGGTKVVAGSSGVATFPGIFLDKIGNGYTLTASASGLSGATSGAFNVTAGPAPGLPLPRSLPRQDRDRLPPPRFGFRAQRRDQRRLQRDGGPRREPHVPDAARDDDRRGADQPRRTHQGPGRVRQPRRRIRGQRDGGHRPEPLGRCALGNDHAGRLPGNRDLCRPHDRQGGRRLHARWRCDRSPRCHERRIRHRRLHGRQAGLHRPTDQHHRRQLHHAGDPGHGARRVEPDRDRLHRQRDHRDRQRSGRRRARGTDNRQRGVGRRHVLRGEHRQERHGLHGDGDGERAAIGDVRAVQHQRRDRLAARVRRAADQHRGGNDDLPAGRG